MIIGVCGYGATGSSAIVSLLKEYEEFTVCDRAEIQEAFKVDGLQDLEYHLMKQYSRHMSGDYAIYRFKQSIKYYNTPIVKKTLNRSDYIKAANEYIDGLVQGSWYGIDNIDYNTGYPLYNFIVLLFKKLVFKNYERLTGKSYNIWPARRMYLSIRPENFYEKTRAYTDKLVALASNNSTKPVVLDQVFDGNAPQNSFPFFNDPKAIVVDRDPRDLYLLTKYCPDGFAEARFMPRKDVYTFVEYYKRLRMYQEKKDSSNILYIQFEDAVYNYDKTKEKIEAFLKCKNHINERKYFNPDISIRNTQIFNNPDFSESIEEVKYIEEQLPDYLFDYSKYPRLTKFEKMF